MRSLWEGSDAYRGTNHDLRFSRRDQLEVTRPVQERVPIWVVALWPRMKSMRRALRCDGIVSQFEGEEHEGTPELVREMRRWLGDNGARPDIDVIAQGETPGDDPTRLRRPPAVVRRRAAPGGSRRTGRCRITPPNGWSRSGRASWPDLRRAADRDA